MYRFDSTRWRAQAYQGVCIGRSGHGINESFTVHKISYGEGVERVPFADNATSDSLVTLSRAEHCRSQ